LVLPPFISGGVMAAALVLKIFYSIAQVKQANSRKLFNTGYLKGKQTSYVWGNTIRATP